MNRWNWSVGGVREAYGEAPHPPCGEEVKVLEEASYCAAHASRVLRA
ncbi:MAG: hypothetical protein RML94_05805 [Bacteroidia bacterium]|nr:hypothetical protein [Bacteroidia bacterium]